MFTLTQLFLFGALLSIVAALIAAHYAYNEGRRSGKRAVEFLLSVCRDNGVTVKLADGNTCPCPECVAERLTERKVEKP